MLSIIIPALNEEKYLPFLLKSIKKQKFSDYEIIVADGGSQDKTVQIARLFGCKITKGGLPAVGRNKGEKIAKGKLLLFLDADTLLPSSNFLQKAIAEFQARGLGIATSWIEPLSTKRKEKFLYSFFYNLPITLMERVLPHGSHLILVRREIHRKIGGFDPEIRLAEDHFYVREGAKWGKFGILRSVKIFTWPRRFYEDGWVKTYAKYVLGELHLIFLGAIKSDIFKYKFNHYSQFHSKHYQEIVCQCMNYLK